MKRRKWIHPLKGRTLKEAMSDLLGIDESEYWTNSGYLFNEGGCALWGMSTRLGVLPHHAYHSWDSLKNCLKYGYSIDDKDCLCANTTDEEERAKE
jgi:hypothetical protein